MSEPIQAESIKVKLSKKPRLIKAKREYIKKRPPMIAERHTATVPPFK